MKTYMWTLEHCQIIITAESKEDAVRIALADTHFTELFTKFLIASLF